MKRNSIRVALKLLPEAEAQTVLLAAEQALGRSILPLQHLKEARVLSFWAEERELERLRKLPGVEKAEPEGRLQIPPAPGRHQAER